MDADEVELGEEAVTVRVEDWYRFRDSEIARLRSSEDVVDRLRAHADDEGTDSRLLDEAVREIRILRDRLAAEQMKNAGTSPAPPAVPHPPGAYRTGEDSSCRCAGSRLEEV